MRISDWSSDVCSSDLEIVRLAASKVRVEIVRSGGKYGSPQYQVRLFAKPDAKVHEILSEGEKTCVALAAFMTELATAMQRSALEIGRASCRERVGQSV